MIKSSATEKFGVPASAGSPLFEIPITPKRQSSPLEEAVSSVFSIAPPNTRQSKRISRIPDPPSRKKYRPNGAITCNLVQFTATTAYKIYLPRGSSPPSKRVQASPSESRLVKVP